MLALAQDESIAFYLNCFFHFVIRIDGTKEENLSFTWSSSSKEICTVPANELVKIDIPDSSTMQIHEDSTTEDLDHLDASKYDAAVGPIKVEGAKRGDVLEIEIIQVSVGTWGWTTLAPDFGLIKNKFERRLIKWRLGGGYARAVDGFLHGIAIPQRPFLGVIATLPSKGNFDLIPPRKFGGNMDNRLLSSGAHIFLPVGVDGAMVSFGDPHASQGDGEVCGTAIETSAQLVTRFRVIKGRNIKTPRARVPTIIEEESIMTSGVSPRLKIASMSAVKEMIKQLNSDYGLTEEEAYVLCSVAGNLKISEIVDEPNYVVSMTLPRKLLMTRLS